LTVVVERSQRVEEGEMELASVQRGLLDGYLDGFLPLIGDKRTEALFRSTVQGIIAGESLTCAQIAASSPALSTSKHGEQRVRRMAKGESTKRSNLGAADLIERLRARGIEQLRDEDEVWAILDPSDLRKPYAREMPDLMRVRKLQGESGGKGEGTVPGYRTLNVLGIGRGGKRGILYHRLFTSKEEDFLSESKEIRDAFDAVGEGLKDKKDKKGSVTYICDTQFDDVAVWGVIWEQGNHLVIRLKHQERRVEAVGEVGEASEATEKRAEMAKEGERSAGEHKPIAELKGQAREVARVRTEMLVRKKGQRLKKRQPVTAVVSSLPIRVPYQVDQRTRADGEVRVKNAHLVVVRLENVDWEPWLLLTDHPVTNEQEGLKVFRMYRERWAIEDCFKFTKEVLGWEDVQLMDLAGIRTLVALGWVAAAFLYELGVSLDWPEVRLLARLGGWSQREDRPPGKVILTRGLQQLLNNLVVEAVLQDEIERYGSLPPRIAAMLGRPSKPEC
jgi:hypothetical protein